MPLLVRFVSVVGDIGTIAAETEGGRKTKGRVAYSAMRNAEHSHSPAWNSLIVSALADLLEGRFAPAMALEPAPAPMPS